MNKYFGTDGIRGAYGSKLTPQFAYAVGLSAGTILKKENIKIAIGKDPRISSDILETALITGLLEAGIDVDSFGVISTPIISYAILNNKYDYGIMISASHNIYSDNGIKLFGSNGQKINDQLEKDIEEVLISKKYNKVEIEKLGKHNFNLNITNQYINYVKGIAKDLSGLKIALDCSHGSAYLIAPEIFAKLGAQVEVIGNIPDGININNQVGSTHIQTLVEYIKDKDFDFGFAYDGDADRLMLVGPNGSVYDGDYIIYILAKHLLKNNQLKDNHVVLTVMANLGLLKSLDQINVTYDKVAVGDRFVMQKLNQDKRSLGGEQSGHIILPDLLPTGDGVLVSVMLASILNEISLKQISQEMQKFPQVLVNKKVENKKVIMTDQKLNQLIDKLSKEIDGKGRILVRASGTEELIRVMVEHQDIDICHQISQEIISYIK